MESGTYHTAQVCLNGHTITSSIEWNPESTASYCACCGEVVVNQCPSCDAKIRGDHYVPGVAAFVNYSPPSFCFNCGKPFPWTTAKIEAAKELAEELDELQPNERAVLKTAIGDLSSGTPRTELAVHRYTNILQKAGSGAQKAMTSIMLEIASETAKKLLFGNGG